MPAIAVSVALVPLENLSGDPAQDIFARGFDDERVTNGNSVEGSYEPRVDLEPGVWRTFPTLLRRPRARLQPRLKDSDWSKPHVQLDTRCS